MRKNRRSRERTIIENKGKLMQINRSQIIKNKKTEAKNHHKRNQNRIKIIIKSSQQNKKITIYKKILKKIISLINTIVRKIQSRLIKKL